MDQLICVLAPQCGLMWTNVIHLGTSRFCSAGGASDCASARARCHLVSIFRMDG